jgi:hypothetical protein
MSTAAPIHITKEDIENATDPFTPVVFKNKNTSMGKAIINYCLPVDFRFIDIQINKKIINNILKELLEKYGEEIAKESAFRLEKQGFKWATLIAPSMTLEDLEVPREVQVLKKQLENASPEKAAEILDKMKEIIKEHLKGTGLYELIDSGAGKGWDQPMQILGAKGIIADPKGRILSPIKSSFADGLTTSEYFKASAGSRKGIVDRVINTSTTGYMSRQLVMLLNSVEAHPNLKDCGTKTYLNIKLKKDDINRLQGRFIWDRGIRDFIPSEHKEGETIKLRSPIYCISPKICHSCYGMLLAKHRSPYIGVLAATRIGERGTQLIMRTFHTGGAVKIEKKDILKDIASNNELLTKEAISHYFLQKESSIITKIDCNVTIDLSYYDEDNNIQIDDANVWMKSLVSTFRFPDGVFFDVILDYPVTFGFIEKEQKDDNLILTYKAGDQIFDVPLENTDIKEQILYIQRLLAGREIFKDVDHLFSRLLRVYSPPVADIDIVHLEVLLSQCLRDVDNPSLAARLRLNKGEFKPVLANIKKNVFATGFLQGLAFENVGEAIRTGLISDTKGEPSVIERLMTGELVNKKKKESS